VAQAVKIGEWPGNGPPRFDESGNRALIDFHFETAEDSYVYTATFFKTKGTWSFAVFGKHSSSSVSKRPPSKG
jgi:hypothetical protein